jgi:N-acetylmuramoyl-L-alanine amidase
MRHRLIVGFIFLLVETCALVAAQIPQQTQNPPQSQQNPPKPAATPAAPSQQTAPAQPSAQNGVSTQQAPAPQPQTLRVVVIDPAHGGADTGARGANGVAEKDIVLEYSRQVAAALQAEGFAVVMTRQNDTDPTADDRATIANGESDAIFISLHVASTGPVGTARTYFYLFPSHIPATAAATTNPDSQSPNLPPRSAASAAGFLPWQEAQRPFVAQSQRLGDLIQSELSKQFKDSPNVSWGAPVFALRSITEPAVAVEVSSIAANPQQLEAMASPLAKGIAQAVAGYKNIYLAGSR